MGIILFLVDTSASMNQKTYLGTSCLDVAKVAIETFMKVRLVSGGGASCVRGSDTCFLCIVISCIYHNDNTCPPPPYTVSYEGSGQQRGPLYVSVF